MAEELRFGIIAEDQASGPLGDVSDAARRTGDALSGPASSGAGAFESALSQVERASNETRQATDRLGETVGDSAGDFREGENAAGRYDSALRRELLGTFGRLETAIEQLINAQQGQETQTVKNTSSARGWASTLTGVNQAVELAKTGISALSNTAQSLYETLVINTATLDRFALMIGTTATELSGFEFAGKTIGQDLDSVGEAFITLQENISDFVEAGAGPAAEAIQALGIQALDSQGQMKPFADLLPEVADRLAAMIDPANRIRLAKQLLGDEDARLLPILIKGREGLEAYTARAKELGVVVSAELVEQSKRLRVGMVEAGESIRGIGLAIAEAVLPALNNVIPKIAEFFINFRESEFFQSTLIPALQDVVAWLDNLVNNFDTFGPRLQEFGASFAALGATIYETITGGITLWGEFSEAASLALETISQEGVFEPLNTSVRSAREEVGAFARAWELVNAVIGVATGGIFELRRWIKATDAAINDLIITVLDWLDNFIPGLSKVTESLQRTTAALRKTAQEEAFLRNAAFETAGEWVDGANRIGKAQEKVTEKVIETGKAAEKSKDLYAELLQRIKDDAERKAAPALDDIKKRTEAVGVAAVNAAQDWTRLGVTTKATLEEQATRALQAFVRRVQDATTNTADLRAAWPAVGEAIAKVTDGAVLSFDQAMPLIRSQVKSSVEAVGSSIQTIGAAADGTTSQVVRGFTIQKDEAKKSWTLIQDSVVQSAVNIDVAMRNTEKGVRTVFTNSGEAGDRLFDRLKTASEQGTKSIIDNFPPIAEAAKAAFEAIEADAEAMQRLIASGMDEVTARMTLAFNKMQEAADGVAPKINTIADRFQTLSTWQERNPLPEAQFRRFGTTVQALSADIEYYFNQAIAYGNAVAAATDGTGIILAHNAEVMREAFRTVHDRLRDLTIAQFENSQSLEGLTAQQVGILQSAIRLGQVNAEITGGFLDLRSSVEDNIETIRIYDRDLKILTDSNADVLLGVEEANEGFGALEETVRRGARSIVNYREESELFRAALGDLDETADNVVDTMEEVSALFLKEHFANAIAGAEGFSAALDLSADRLARLEDAYGQLGITIPSVAKQNAIEQITSFREVLAAGELTTGQIQGIWEDLAGDISQSFFGIENLGEVTFDALREAWGTSAGSMIGTATQLGGIFTQIFRSLDDGFVRSEDSVRQLMLALGQMENVLNSLRSTQEEATSATNDHAMAVAGLTGAFEELEEATRVLGQGPAQGRPSRNAGGAAGAGLPGVSLTQTQNEFHIRLEQAFSADELAGQINELIRRGDIQTVSTRE